MKRIFVSGCVGVGKTTFAKKLSEKLKFPLIMVDFIVCDEDWKRRRLKDRDKIVKKILKKKNWIIEGVHTSDWILPILKKTDLIIYLDYNKKTIYKRIFKRYKEGKLEKSAYGKLSSLVYLLYPTFMFDSQNYLKKLESFGKKVVVLKDDSEVERFLREIN